MHISVEINGHNFELEISPSDNVLSILRKNGFFSVKKGGCSKGECGACTILLDGKPVNSCTILAAQVDGHRIETIEAMGERPLNGWRITEGLSIIQNAFVESGAVQCGYCTPAMILSIHALLKKKSNPTDAEIREALSGILCRCTGYLIPVQAAQRAAAILRGELPNSGMGTQGFPEETDPNNFDYNSNGYIFPEIPVTTDLLVRTQPQKSIKTKWETAGRPEPKVDANKLVQGKPAFTSDIEIKNLLHAKVLTSPYAHAIIKGIDTTKALQLPGVAAVLTWKDLPRVPFSTAGQSDPIPGPLDTFSLNKKVRFVGDRVAFVAAETIEIAEQALKLISVDYEVLPALLDPALSQNPDMPIIHDEIEYQNFADSDPNRNLAAKIRIDIGDVERGFQDADEIFEADYEVSKVQQAHIEPHVVITYWDEDDRLVIRSSTQVPFHARRILAPVLGLPVKRIRVIKPRIGGGFGGKQEVLTEDVAAHLTIATGRPVLYEFTREDEFVSSRSRHPMKIHMKTGVKKDGVITANEMRVLADTGAYGGHALTVSGNTGHKPMALYVGEGPYRNSPNIRFYADIVYTNHPPAGAFRGYGVPQGFWAVDRHMEKIARALKIDPIDFRMKNTVKPGDVHPFSAAWSEGREPRPEIIHTVGLEQCVAQGKAIIGWDQKFSNQEWHSVKGKPYLRKGIGIALVMHGTAIPYLDMGGASIKMNDDGSFNLLMGATDLGTGSDTVLAQMAAEILGVHLDDIIVYSSDTDFTPFDKGAYASSTTYISGAAVAKAAQQVADQIKMRAVKIWNSRGFQEIDKNSVTLASQKAVTNDGKSLSLQEIALHALHQEDQEQIMAVASFFSPVSPPPFAAQFAEVTVDVETGSLIVDHLVTAVDAGMIINPITASGQVEGGMAQALGYAICEEMKYDSHGRARETDLENYHIMRSTEMPELSTVLVQTYEPSHPFGVKAIAEIPMDGVAPAVANAVRDACGVDIDTLPVEPEKIWRSLSKATIKQG